MSCVLPACSLAPGIRLERRFAASRSCCFCYCCCGCCSLAATAADNATIATVTSLPPPALYRLLHFVCHQNPFVSLKLLK
eukprot:g11833.t1